MQSVSASINTDPQARAMLEAMRGTNINDDDAAAAGTTLRVVEMQDGEGDDVLPTVYDPAALDAYFSKRPGAVLTRVAQLAATGGAWILTTAFAALRGDLKQGSDAEVEAVAGLRNVLVSLGPFYIKLGQGAPPT